MTDVQVFDQTDLESSITSKANRILIIKDIEQDEKRLDKLQKEVSKSTKHLNSLISKLSNPKTKISEKKLKNDISWFENNDLNPKKQDLKDIKLRILENQNLLIKIDSGETTKTDDQSGDNGRLPDETEREYLIRIGKITAFGNENSFKSIDGNTSKQSHIFLKKPGFDDVEELTSDYKKDSDFEKKTSDNNEIEEIQDLEKNDEEVEQDSDDDEDYKYNEEEIEKEEEESKLDDQIEEIEEENNEDEETRNIDDGNELYYQKRLKQWIKKRSSLRKKSSTNSKESEEKEEWFKPHPTIPDAELNDVFKLPGDIYPSLFDYQKTCVQWLWELYSQKTGGIIGDEMGLGKTIQIISFLAGLHYSGLLKKPVLVVVPATVLNQWVNEFHRWWPPLRCIILHSIGTGMTNNQTEKMSEIEIENFLENSDPKSSKNSLKNIKSQINAKEIINRVMNDGHVLITTYVGLRIYSKYILPRQWGYVVLDEGHKIRNPDSDISLTCKQIKTVNRIILSGTPIQNNLIELWSLFDFIFPGRLGTLPVFQNQFSIPINIGGYANSNNLQVKTAYKCACVLRDLISPYLLRRLKKDVAQDLPKKNEMVLFVKLTELQQDLYEKFLNSEDFNSIIKGKRNVLMGVDILRKICNHPDLIYRDSNKYKENYGDFQKSGKMQVLKNLLQLWQNENHKTLLFCQTRQMLDILEKFISNLSTLKNSDEKFTYLRMDGSTPIAKRQYLVDNFNNDPNLNVFLLTTKVGGLGVNLTGADRVIIYDPDWNPSTDIQARERAWRLGQKKDITIYRLMTTGTIEEKIYHRQIFKTFLTNKILKDPKQKRFFKNNDLQDLFTLGDQNEQGTETGDLFNNGKEDKYSGTKQRKSNSLIKKNFKNDDDFYQVAKISGVSKLDKFEEGEDQNEEEEQQQKEDPEDNRIMAGIFAKSGVHSSLKHDEVINSKDNQEISLLEREANKYANEAIEALKQSRLQTKKNKIGTPTWTGRFGSAGKNLKGTFGVKKRKVENTENGNGNGNEVVQEGEASSTILNILKQKNDLKTNEKKSKEAISRQETIEKIITFLKNQPNFFATSSSIIQGCDLKLVSDESMIMIRSMLREVATWDGVKRGWKLNDSLIDL
ncbi:rhp26 [Candida pseudojiufengensis]|uniref:rhp26 n=1 Tax=Candida pseudojiufengensis TaxID=497109 RepID=UPI002224B042|nr:rhp26 [Candida pseudojiufengensis]KAI5962679.1 rhp26 [Candida pseudojiufengensis]